MAITRRPKLAVAVCYRPDTDSLCRTVHQLVAAAQNTGTARSADRAQGWGARWWRNRLRRRKLYQDSIQGSSMGSRRSRRSSRSSSSVWLVCGSEVMLRWCGPALAWRQLVHWATAPPPHPPAPLLLLLLLSYSSCSSSPAPQSGGNLQSSNTAKLCLSSQHRSDIKNTKTSKSDFFRYLKKTICKTRMLLAESFFSK